MVSILKITDKAKIRKLPLPESPEVYIPSRVDYYEFKVLSIEMKDMLQIWQLENHHQDPLDRLLIAQS